MSCKHGTRSHTQSRVTSAVWGLLLVGMGVALTLDDRDILKLPAPAQFPAAQAVDGDPKTRWASEWGDDEWISVDLGASSPIAKVLLRWEVAYASAYDIAVSDDGQRWTTVAEVKNGDGEVDEHAVEAQGRYVRVTGRERAPIPQEGRHNRYGISLWEIEVFDSAGRRLSEGRTATASSSEHRNLLTIYWPVFLIASGLPLFLVPKDQGERVFGTLMMGGGGIFLLRNLEIVRIGFWQTVPIFLVLTGLLFILEAFRQGNGDQAPRTGSSSATENA